MLGEVADWCVVIWLLYPEILRASLHHGHGPMDRVMAGRQTPSLEYKPVPLHKSRSELLEARKAGMRDSMTYDLDGDGQCARMWAEIGCAFICARVFSI